MTRTPICIVTGYLGSGKTTLLRRVIEQSGRKIAIVMNEFGEIGIDGRVLKGKNVDMVELNGGCVCCSLIGEFEAAIREIISTFNPDSIIVETTGVAEPDSLIVNIQDSLPEVRLDSIVTIADSYSMIKFPSLGYTGRLQIEIADLIIVNKIDLVAIEDLQKVIEMIRNINDRAIILKAVRCAINTELLFGLSVDKVIVRKERDHIEEERIESISYKPTGRLDREKFESFLGSLSNDFYRAKGFVRFDDGDYLFNYVAGRWDFEPFKFEDSSIVFIGQGIASKADEVIELLRQCELII